MAIRNAWSVTPGRYCGNRSRFRMASRMRSALLISASNRGTTSDLATTVELTLWQKLDVIKDQELIGRHFNDAESQRVIAGTSNLDEQLFEMEFAFA